MWSTQIRRLLWLALSFTLALCWIQAVKYSLDIGQADGTDNSRKQPIHNLPTLPPFDGKMHNLGGAWEIVPEDHSYVQAFLAETERTAKDPKERHWLNVQKIRRGSVREYCQQHRELRLPVNKLTRRDVVTFYKTVLKGTRHDALYCPVGKVACTSWKTALAMLQGHFDGLRPGEHIHDLPVLIRNKIQPISMAKQPESIITTHPMFLFVRHPFERLVSAFKNKFQAQNKEDLQMKYGRDIMKRYRHPGKASDKELQTGWGVKFPEFIKWVLDDNVRNVHWDTFNDICHLCSVPYVFIGKMDTFTEDTKYILKYLFGKERFDKFPHSNPSPKVSRKPLESYFKDVSDEDINRLKERYDIDFKMFQYSWPMI